MDCLVYFLSDIYQKKLRRLAQVKCECYEDALDEYKNLYISYFGDVVNNKMCKSCELECSDECDNLRDIMKTIDKDEIIDFFNTLKQTYVKWIDAKLSESLNIFNNLLEEKKVLEFHAEGIDKDIFFKGRVSDEILTKWEMFHIPFNKRYLINNQRYSLTGQPIMYLGKSVVDVVEELNLPIEDFQKLKISTVEIKDNLKIYDLRNDIYNDIINHDMNKILVETNNIKLYDKIKFFKNILASVCSFEKRKEHRGFSFCEEYVIPQILAQTLKNKTYDGIIYYSTKRFEQLVINDNNKSGNNNKKIKELIRSEYKENVAIFTNITSDHVYDRELYEKLDISVPIDFSKVDDVDVKDIEDIKLKIERNGNQEEITKANLIVSKLDTEFKILSINNKEYYNTNVGKLHIYNIYSILNKMLAECNKG